MDQEGHWKLQIQNPALGPALQWASLMAKKWFWFCCFGFLDFMLKFFLDTPDGYVSKTVTCIGESGIL